MTDYTAFRNLDLAVQLMHPADEAPDPALLREAARRLLRREPSPPCPSCGPSRRLLPGEATVEMLADKLSGGPGRELRPGEPTLDLLDRRGGLIRRRHNSRRCDPPAGEHGDVWECPDCGRRWLYKAPGNPEYAGWRLLLWWPRNWWWR